MHLKLLIIFSFAIYFAIDAATVSNVNVKLLTPLRKRLKPGDKISVIGTLTDPNSRGQINLQFGDCMNYNHMCDIPFSLDMRPMDQTVHRLIHRAETKSYLFHESDGGFPLKVNEKYLVEITVHEDFYEIFINGKYFAVFNHRMPIERVNHVLITMETIVDFIEIEHIEDKSESCTISV